MAEQWITTSQSPDALCIHLSGDWELGRFSDIQRALDATIAQLAQSFSPSNVPHTVSLDASRLTRLDPSLAWLLQQGIHQIRQVGFTLDMSPDNPKLHMLRILPEISEVRTGDASSNSLKYQIIRLYAKLQSKFKNGVELLGFVGQSAIFFTKLLPHPRRIRVQSLAFHIQKGCFDAMPIVGLMTFLVGVVLAYLGFVQLEKFGADILTINLVGVAVLREIGVIMAAVMIAGRTGSSYTAQIGVMKMNQEVDALQTMGQNIMEVLVAPRVLALVLTFPLLVFWSDMMGILGGATVCLVALDITWVQFLKQLQQAVTPTHFFVGMIKAPIFAAIIALVGCMKGLAVKKNAQSIGEMTTASVVQSIFWVVIVDAAFAVFFSYMDI